ncbi:1434_t:CDS:2 [Diversispora eburnea]|uniref:1434_t:CDS:1 n=1 Tax=Diversispora eburnea TaxID=1213867 RepID=A0A9N8V2T3_9GLOM|nr:1434_t:CDS:2 [Diversispora eburnea]
MAQTYAEVAKKSHNEVDATEDTEADLIVNNSNLQNSVNNQVRINGTDYNNNQFEEDKSSENFEATLSLNRDVFDSDTTRSIDDNKSKETSRKRSKGGKRKVSKKVIALGVAVDIVIAGLVTSWIIKRPSVNKTHVGLGTVGLGLFYGAQCF